jgi:hypothetical protein
MCHTPTNSPHCASPAIRYCRTPILLRGCRWRTWNRFFVKSLRRVLDQIRDEALREDADRFSCQTAQHCRRHMDFNKAVLAQVSGQRAT